ncbi:AtpI2 [Desulfamplus magnetovallimortis]|uniref:AtpI2 n=1 Tax=Desulfamplus magnetovallimortis TaxID=1246637 RepID=A0A1W1HCL5_9BACT|nr:AtpZ/AtpI family protein [Desulfamplus magnetovallimortis]SLM30128.1 AtpI2 [Desulfamplus magnetovallimortis]
MAKKKFSTVRELAYYSSLGLTVALSIFIGLFLGVWLDGVFDTKPVLTMVFLGFGIAAGFRNLLMAARRSRNL